jgi:para-nitrobenzyl esterase
MYQAPQLILDGVSLPQRSLLAQFSDPETAPKVPAIFGSNRDEGRLFMLRDPQFVDAHLGVFYREKDRESYDRVANYASRTWKLVGSDAPARAIRSSEVSSVWTYRFDWDETSSSLFADLPFLLGAAHGMEIPFVFGDLTFPIPGIFTDDNLVAAETLSAAMRSYWSEFAYRGDPGRGREGELPQWSSWQQGEQFMILDTQSGGGLRLSDELEHAETLQAQLLADENFSNPKHVCELYAKTFVYTSWWQNDQYQKLAGGACGKKHPDYFFLKRI